MDIHIGNIIRDFVANVKIDNMDTFCLQKLHMTKQNYYRIIKKSSINTEVLLTFCKAFNHDFFQYYYDFEPLSSISKIDSHKLTMENQELRGIIERKEDLLKDYERKIMILKEENQLLKESAQSNTLIKRKKNK
ncbi:hypothetical protein [Olivibacter sitiensis]|uniref:hypothetical protein n=1 Tax=Olivibacter sitiensis TaxID=376470 RepID=UPI000487A97A|nr:hypothetical protein [Olivibacter sitiensis]